MPRLRILATSDLHAHAQPYDYLADKPDPTHGLAAAAALIETARREAEEAGAACLLLDNGDLLQGAAIGDLCGREGLGEGARHPMIAALAALGCDAATPGNHEFNYGLAFVERAYADAPFPFVCANVARPDGTTFLPHSVVLERAVPGLPRPVRVAVTGVLPPQILMWDKALLEGRLVVEDMVDALARTVPVLREAGADIVVVLCHSGISEAPREGGEENAALHVAREVPGIDVLITGHLHRVFPGTRDFAGIADVDVETGRLAGVPAVMPGFHGSHVGIVDLDLRTASDGAIRIGAATVAARRTPALADPPSAAARAVIDATAGIHARTLAFVREPVGETLHPIDTYFTALGDDGDLALLAMAQETFVRAHLAGTEYADLPLLSSAAPFIAGGRAGAEAFVDIPAGRVAMRDLAALYPYPNAVCAVRVTGAEIREWLERAAGLYNHIDPARPGPVELVDRRFPSYHFDMIRGLTYTIDPSAPSRYDRDGGLVDPGAKRIRDVRHGGRAVGDDDVFVLATNTYRAGGGGRFCGGRLQAIFTTTELVRDVLRDFVTRSSPLRVEGGLAWQLVLPEGVDVRYPTCARAAGREPPAWGLEDLGRDSDGYRVYRVHGRRNARA